MDDLGPVEEARSLLRRLEAVPDVVIGEDLVQRAASRVLAQDVLRNALLSYGALEEEREEVLQHDVPSLDG